MNFDLKKLDLDAAASEKCDLLAVLVTEEFKAGKDPLSALAGQAIKQGDFSAKLGKVLQCYNAPAAVARRVVLLGAGDGSARAVPAGCRRYHADAGQPAGPQRLQRGGGGCRGAPACGGTGARNVPYDTPLRLRFDRPPVLGTQGAIRVLRKRDNALADTIRVADEYDVLGYEGQQYRRAVRRQPIAIEGRNVTINLHSARLQPGEEYYVTIDDGVFAGTLNGQPFNGVAKGQGWTFRTRAAVPRRQYLTVDDDGAADFRTVQGALNHVMRQPQGARPELLLRGTYSEGFRAPNL
eukprot:gene39598-48924_t